MSESIHGKTELTPEVLTARERFLAVATQFLPLPELIKDGQQGKASYDILNSPDQWLPAKSLSVSFEDYDPYQGAGPNEVNDERVTSIGLVLDLEGLDNKIGYEPHARRITHQQGGDADGEFVEWLGEQYWDVTDMQRVHDFVDLVHAAMRIGRIATEPTPEA